MSHLYDPRQKEIRTLIDNQTNAPIESGSGVAHTKKCCEQVRLLATEGKYPLNAVPVVHRLKGVPRHWDVRQGQSGATLFCEQLCAQDWRFATKEEEAEYLASCEQARADASKAILDKQAANFSNSLFKSFAATMELENKAKDSKSKDKKSKEEKAQE